MLNRSGSGVTSKLIKITPALPKCQRSRTLKIAHPGLFSLPFLCSWAVLLKQLLSSKSLARMLDNGIRKPRIKTSPPIRFRIEWACGQGNRHRFLVSGPFKFFGATNILDKSSLETVRFWREIGRAHV